jgi:hypothetical protein
VRRDPILALAIAAGVFALQLPVRLCAVNLLDEGTILQMAAEILAGKHLYADAVHYAFPGVFYLTALAFAVGGTSIGTARTLVIALFAIAAAAVFLMARWSHSRRGALVVLIVFLAYRVWAYPHWQTLSYSTLAVMLILVATCAVGTALGGHRLWPFALAGAVSGAAVLSKQDSGVAGTAALALGLLVMERRRLGRFIAFASGTLLIVGAAAVAITAAGLMPDLVRETILAPLYGARHFTYPGRPALWPLLRQDPALRNNVFSYVPPILLDLHWPAISRSAVYRDTAITDAALRCIFHLPWIAVVAGVLVAGRDRGADDLRARRERLLLCVGAGFLAAFNPPRDWVHLMVLYPPTLLIGAVVVGRLAGGWRLLQTMVTVLVAAGALASAALMVELARRQATPVQSARGRLYAAPPQAEPLQALLDGVAAAVPPGAPLVALPYHALVNFLAARPVLTRYYVIWPIDPDRTRDETIIRRLASTPEALVVYSPTQVPHFPRFATYAGPLLGYLADHFRIAETYSHPDGFTFFLLGHRAEKRGVSLLGPALAGARVRIEPAAGPTREVTEAERADLVTEALWPVTRSLAVTTVPEGTVAVVYRLTPGPGERFEAGYGVNPDRWDVFAPPVRFALAVTDEGGVERELLAAEVDPQVPAGRRWTSARIDLSPWVGRAIAITLRVTGPSGGPPRPDLAGWADPRLVPGE